MELTRIAYSKLNARQKENFNFQKVSAVLADYGFVTLRLSDDWNGADFIAQHIDGVSLLRVQLKSRLAFGEKYRGKDLWIVFNDGPTWYLYPHDRVLERMLEITNIGSTASWIDQGAYSFPGVPKEVKALLDVYRINGDAMPIPEANPDPGTA